MYIFPYRSWPCQLTDGRNVQPHITCGRRPKAKDREKRRYALNSVVFGTARRASVPAFGTHPLGLQRLRGENPHRGISKLVAAEGRPL